MTIRGGKGQMSEDANRRFVDMANPHSWLLTASNLHAQALSLRKSVGRSGITFIDYRYGERVWWDGANRSTYLLGGFALENAIKAFLVYENPAWISNGRLSRELRSHSLTALQQKSKLIPFKNRYVWVLKGFEDGLESWSRYPCALTVEQSALELQMTDALWRGYLRLMDGYGNRLRKLFSKQWRGPHGFSGAFHFYSGEESSDDMGKQGYKSISTYNRQQLSSRRR